MTPPIVLAPLKRTAVARVHHLELPASQEAFVGRVEDMTDEPDLIQDFHHVTSEAVVVGFFKIDRDFSRRVTHLPRGCHALRGLLVGGQFQRRGFGTAILQALPAYVRDRYGVDRLWLSVDCANSVAVDAYASNGWARHGPDFPGRSGPEFVMRLDLPVAQINRSTS